MRPVRSGFAGSNLTKPQVCQILQYRGIFPVFSNAGRRLDAKVTNERTPSPATGLTHFDSRRRGATAEFVRQGADQEHVNVRAGLCGEGMLQVRPERRRLAPDEGQRGALLVRPLRRGGRAKPLPGLGGYLHRVRGSRRTCPARRDRRRAFVQVVSQTKVQQRKRRLWRRTPRVHQIVVRQVMRRVTDHSRSLRIAAHRRRPGCHRLAPARQSIPPLAVGWLPGASATVRRRSAD